MVVRAAWQRRNARYHESAPADGVNPDNRTIDLYLSTPFDQDDDSYTAEVSLNGRVSGLGAQHDLLLALEYYYVNSEQFSFFGMAPDVALLPLDIFEPQYQEYADVMSMTRNNYFHPNDRWTSVVAQDMVSLSRNTKILLSVRYDNVRQSTESCGTDNVPGCPPSAVATTDYDRITPRVGISHRIRPWLVAFGSYSEALGSSSLGILRDGSRTEPEEAHQYEIGLKGTWLDGDLNANVALYDLTKSNIRTPIPGQSGIVDQIGEANSRGVELDISARMSESWDVIASYAFMDAKVTEDRDSSGGLGNRGNALPNAPAHSGS
jgi:iron complex outermembrane receptor protein